MSKKITINKANLPDINAETGSYDVRFRLISEDRNKLSYWSPIYTVNPELEFITDEIEVDKIGRQVSVIWDTAEKTQLVKSNDSFVRKNVGPVERYDVWFRYYRSDLADPEELELGDWVYKERVDSTSLLTLLSKTYTINNQVVIGKTPNRLDIEVYAPGRPIIRETSLFLYSVERFWIGGGTDPEA
jgi:hypothetical protein